MRDDQRTHAGPGERRESPGRRKPVSAAPRQQRAAAIAHPRLPSAHLTPVAVCIACCLLVVSAAGPVAADRDARVITPRGSPVWLDPFRALLFDSPGILVMLENHHLEPVASTLRVWLFDPDLRLKASVDYCAIDLLDRYTRARLFVPLEIPGVTLRDRAVVTVAAAGSAQTVWRLRESDGEQLAAARAAIQGSAAHLTLDRNARAQPVWECPCDPPAIEASCIERCAGTGLAAHGATRLVNAGCSASCTCR